MKIMLASMTVKPEVIIGLKAIGGDAITVADTEAAAIAALDGANAAIVSDNAYTAGLANALAASPTLQFLQIMTAGYDNATRLGLPRRATIASVGAAFSPSVALHAVALMLALQRGIAQMATSKTTRHWDKALAGTLTMALGKTCTILGYGSIGREIARMVAPLGMKVIGLNRTGVPHPLAAEVHRIDALHAILPRTDVLIIAAPHNPSTDKIIGATELALMKPTALLVNISRGKLVDTPALNEALRAGRIAGAALDVTEPEPLPQDHPLWDAPNLIVSPHVAGAAGNFGAERQLEFVGANLRRYLAGEPVQNIVISPSPPHTS